MQNEPPPGAPHITLELPSRYGTQLKTLESDSNRLHPVKSFEWHALNALAIPARPIDQLLQIAGHIGTSASLTSWGVVFLPDFKLAIVIGLLLICFSAIGAYTSKHFPQLQYFLAYRLLLFTLGMVLGLLVRWRVPN